MTSRNQTLFERAQQTIPGGVNSPVRAFRSVGGTPRFISRAHGPHVWDADGKCYIDYVGSWGPAITGHAHPDIVAAVREAALAGLSFGAPTEAEVEMAETLCKLMPSLEMVRLVSSGTEATMSAIRLARGFTGRDAIIKFEGCYHGHADSLLVKAGSGLLTFGNPSSGGVPEDFAKHTIVLDFNDLGQVEQAFKQRGNEIAAKRGILIADTKFEFGLDESGVLYLIDEALTYEATIYERSTGAVRRTIRVGQYVVDRGERFIAISLDEFIIAYFLGGNETVLSVYIFGQFRFPKNVPSILALGTVLVLLSVILLTIAEYFRRRGIAKTGGKDTGGFL